MIPRILEPEVMDTPEEAVEYDAMNHTEVNRLFVSDLLQGMQHIGMTAPQLVLDVGTGTALIPIELCRQANTQNKIVAVDLAEEMLRLAQKNIDDAQLTSQIFVRLVDAKGLNDEDSTYDVVMSNTIVHHIPDPKIAMAEMYRVLKPGGLLFVRDLLRPNSQAELDRLVKLHAEGESVSARKLFSDSLHAALTVEEIRSICGETGIEPVTIKATSDRHWTLVCCKERI